MICGVSILLLCLSVPVSHAGELDILAVAPLSTSHSIQMEILATTIQERGYNVTYAIYRGHPWVGRARRLGFPVLEFQFDLGEPGLDYVKEKMYNTTFEASYSPEVSWSLEMFRWYNAQCNDALHDSTFMAAVKDGNFKLALVDGFAWGPCPMLIPYVAGIPMVAITSGYLPLEIGSPALPSFVPMPGFTSYSSSMSLFEKLHNLYLMVHTQSDYNIMRREMRVLCEHTSFTSWRQLYDKVSLFILPRDHHLDFSHPTMPHILALPGITYSPPKKLPKELEDAVKNKPVFIVVAFGTVLPNIPGEVVEELLDAFRMLPEIPVLWVYKESTDSFKIPNNVRFYKNLPQNDLLGHKKAGLYVSHCGNNGQYEAAYHGIPQLCFPMFADQKFNGRRIEHRGLGKSFGTFKFNAKAVVKTIKEILSNATLKDQCVKMSAILKSYKLPRERAADAVEHVMRFGDEHLRNEASKMPWYTLWMLDIVGFLFMIACIVFMLIVFFCKLIWNTCCAKSTKLKKH